MMDIRSCTNCHCLFNEDFKRVASLKNSGLIIYIHYNKSKQKRYYGDHSGSNIILHNTSNRDIKRFDYIVELCQYRTKCLRCKMLIQQVRNIIDEISVINKNDVIGVCDFCKRSNQKIKCKRCQYMVEKFMTNKAIEIEKRDVQFKQWLSKLQQILRSFLDAKVICKHNICLDFEYKSQLHRLLNSLNSRVPMRQPEIDSFPDFRHLKETGVDIGENEKFIEDLVTRLKYKELGENKDIELSFNSFGSESDCICKHLVSNKSDQKHLSSSEVMSEDIISLRKTSTSKGDVNESSNEMTSSKYQQQVKSKSETVTEKPSSGPKSKSTEESKKTQNKYFKSNKENESPNKSIKSNKNAKKNKIVVKKGSELNGVENKGTEKKGTHKGKKEKRNSEYRLMMEMLNQREEEKKVIKQLEKSKKKLDLPIIKDLPDIKTHIRQLKEDNLDTEESESILECKDNRLDAVTEMIKGTDIVHFDPKLRSIEEEYEKLPLLFKIKTDVTVPNDNRQTLSLPMTKSDKIKKLDKVASKINPGIIRYELSNREFIEKGWTKLPSTKIMRKMNIYKMLSASDKFDWFQNYKTQEYLLYHTGEKFAEINESGGGKWFYKNGNVALDGYCGKDSNKVKRYVIYSSGEEIISKKKEPPTILACFDYNGYGVVYDCYGNVRLKYNQSEGVVIDKNIGPPSHWKWHTLNDPPVLQQVFLNTYDNKNECFETDVSESKTKANEEMIAIELDNFVKEKANKLMQKFKPFQIRIKALKINDLFSLRIVDQANIFLLFRCDGIYFKINIGLLLKSDEIIDTDISEMSQVSTPYDKFPPKSPSLINLNKTISNVRNRYSVFRKD